MNASDLKLNTLYKLNLFATPANARLLGDLETQITLVSTDGDYDAATPGAILPFSGIDYLYWEGSGTFNVDDHGDNESGRATGATYILYYITTLNTSECTTLARYSEECHMGNVIKISQIDYDTIFNAYPRPATISTGATITYDPQAIYLIDRPKKYRHNIQLILTDGMSGGSREKAYFSFINQRATVYSDSSTGYTTLCSDLYSAGFTSANTLCPAKGELGNNIDIKLPIGIYASSTSVYFKFIYLFTKYSSDNATITFHQQVHSSTKQALNFYVDPSYSTINSSHLYDVIEEI